MHYESLPSNDQEIFVDTYRRKHIIWKKLERPSWGPFHLISTPPCRRRLPRGSWFSIFPRGGAKDLHFKISEGFCKWGLSTTSSEGVVIFYSSQGGRQKICISKFLKVLQIRHVADVFRGGNIDFLFFWGGNRISKFPKGFANLACGPRLPTKGVLIFNFSEGGGVKNSHF